MQERPKRLLIVAMIVAAGLSAASCSSKKPDIRRAIVILLDAARADRFSSYGYNQLTTPRLDSLAKRGVVFRQHFTHGTATRSTIPSLLYSRYFVPPIFPSSARVPLSRPAELFQILDAEAVSLPAALAESGVFTSAISGHTWLREGSQFAHEFDELHELPAVLDYPRKYAYPRAKQVVDFALDWLVENRDRDFFLYLHFMDTHFPHFFEEDAALFSQDPGLEGRVEARFNAGGRPHELGEPLTGDDRRYLDSLYDGSLRYADRHIGRLIDYLDSGQMLDDTLIVVTSDHGENLLEVAERFDHGGRWYDAVARVPLIVFYPQRLGSSVVTAPTEAVDVMPTVLDLLNVELPEGKTVDGISLAAVVDGSLRPRGFAVSSLGVRTEEYGLVLSGRGVKGAEKAIARGRVPDIEEVDGDLFRMETDPLEQENIWEAEADVVRRLLAEYGERLSRPYRRFVGSRSTAPPISAFAIAARDFILLPETAFSEEAPAKVAKPLPGEPRWQRVKHWQHFRLTGWPDGPTIQLAFDLPEGEYDLSVDVRGLCRVRALSGPFVDLVGSEGPSGNPGEQRLRRRQERYGRVRVVGREFKAQISAPGSDLCEVRSFGFEPVGGGLPASEAEQEELENRLRALGYLD